MRKNKKYIINNINLFIFIIFTFFINVNFVIDKNIINVKKDVFCFNNYNFNILYDFNINFECGNNFYNLKNFTNCKISDRQTEILLKGIDFRRKIMCFALNNGFSIEESVSYAFPEIVNFLNFIETKYCYSAVNSKLVSKSNTGNIFVSDPKKGCELDKNALYYDLFNKISLKNKEINIKLRFLDVNYDFDKNYYSDKIFLRGSFKTLFNLSSESRKNNIKIALKSLDGKVLLPNEILSFNEITGDRIEKNGYKKAKTIKNGSYFEEYGGGVCQVSTTLYNASVLADLEIIEVHPHSLPVTYVEPCFDAMVNSGSSDLLIRNNTNFPIIFATSSENNECLVNVYGVKNHFNIKRVSKKLENINGFDKEIIKDYKLVGLDKPLNNGEMKIISNGKPGYKAVGILEYYKNGLLVKTKKIRNDSYRPTKEVVLVG